MAKNIDGFRSIMFEKLPEIKAMCERGAKAADIAAFVDVHPVTLYSFLKAQNLQIKKGVLNRFKDKIALLVDNGSQATEIAEMLGVNYQVLCRFCRDNNIPLKRGIKVTQKTLTRRASIVAFYMENHTLEETGQKTGITRERVRQIINLMGYQPRQSTRITSFRETLKKDRWFLLTSRERFWSYVDIRGENDCWEWQGARFKAQYGHFSYRGLNEQYAHRIAYILTNRKLPKNHVLHSCDNPPCVNPKHLRDGTHAENMRDREERGRGAWQKDYEGMRQKLRAAWEAGKFANCSGAGGGRYTAILTPDQVSEIKAYLINGTFKQVDLAKKYGVKPGAICEIKQGRNWKDIEPKNFSEKV
jgi:hypothetical protein